MTTDNHDENRNIQNILRELTAEVVKSNATGDANNVTLKYILDQMGIMNGSRADHERRISRMEGGRTVLWQSVTVFVALSAVGVAVMVVMAK